MSGMQLSEQDKKEYDAILSEWMEKIEEIRPYEERNSDRNNGMCLDGGYNGPYTELEKIYKPKLDKILGRDVQEEKDILSKSKRRKFSDMIIPNPHGFPDLPKNK